MKNKEGRFRHFNSALQNFDLFGEQISFLQSGKSQFTTNCGALLSILIITLVITYAQNKFQVLMEHGDTIH